VIEHVAQIVNLAVIVPQLRVAGRRDVGIVQVDESDLRIL
jgi:hypothetical protein